MPKAKKPSIDINAEVQAAIKVITPAVKKLKKNLNGTLDPEKLPIGMVVDLLYEIRGLKKLVNTITSPFDDIVQPAEKALEEHFINTLAVGESSGVQGQMARVQITESIIPVVEDWEKFYKHIAKTKSFELLNRAVNRTAVQERWDDRKQVPGVGSFHAKKVSCTKLGGKK